MESPRIESANLYIGVIDRCRLVNNAYGLYVGELAGLITGVTIRDSAISENLNMGIWAEMQSAGTIALSVESCAVTGNLVGIQASKTGSGGVEAAVSRSLIANNSNVGLLSFSSGGAITVSDCTIMFNATALTFAPGAVLRTRENNTIESNGVEGTFSATFSPK